MDEFKYELKMLLVIEIARLNTAKLIRTHPIEFIKFLTKEKTIAGVESASELLIKAAILFILKSLEVSTKFSPKEKDENLIEFLIEFMEKRS